MSSSSLSYELFTSTTLITLGLYHLTCTLQSHIKSPSTFTSKPIHPLPLPSPTPLRNLPLYLTSFSLLISFLHHTFSSLSPDPLLPLHSLSSLQSSTTSLLFFLLSLSLLLPSLPHDLAFALASASFYLLSSVSSSRASLQSSSLASHLLATSSKISLLSSVLSLSLAFSLKLFIADVALAGTVILQGLWALQTGLTLHVDAFIPEGCHKLLDVVSGVDGSTKCDLDVSKLRAAAILDLMFVVYVVIVVVIVVVVYAVVARAVGGSRRLGSSYEALPNSNVDGSHVQLKTLSGTQA